MMAAKRLERIPSVKLVKRALKRARSLNNSRYQYREKPPHPVLSLLRLNEYTMTRRMGRYISISMSAR
jgi:hypothetical protein